MDKNILEQYVNQGLSSYKIAKLESVSATTIAYWLRKHGLRTKCPYRKGGGKYVKSTLWQIPKEDLQNIINESRTIKQVIEKAGLNVCVYQYQAFKARVCHDGLDISSLKNPKDFLADWQANVYPLDKMLVHDKVVNNSSLKKKLLKTGLIINQCSECHNDGKWMNKPLTLQLDHINGNRTDNRLENIRLLCPNCHSQTPTWGSKRRCEPVSQETQVKSLCIRPPRIFPTKITWPEDEELSKLMWEMKLDDVAAKLGVKSQTILKRCKKKNISRPPFGYWSRRKAGWSHEKSINPPPKDKKTIRKFTDEEVKVIMQRINDGESLRSIAKSMGLGHSILSSIKLGHSYQHLERPWKNELPPRPKWTKHKPL